MLHINRDFGQRVCSDIKPGFKVNVKIILELYEQSLSEAYLFPFGPIWLIFQPHSVYNQAVCSYLE